jgi:hypothetical protein
MWVIVFLSLFIFRNLWLLNDVIFKTNFFIFLFILVFILWYVLNFDFKIIFKKTDGFIQALLGWGLFFLMLFFILFWIFWSWTASAILLFLFVLLLIFNSIDWLKVINTWIYKISVFLLLLVLTFGFMGKGKQIMNIWKEVFQIKKSNNTQLIVNKKDKQPKCLLPKIGKWLFLTGGSVKCFPVNNQSFTNFKVDILDIFK